MDADAADAADTAGGPPDVDAVTHAVLAASRLLVSVSARSLAAVGERVTLPQYRLLAVLATHGDAKLVEVAERLGVNPSTAMRMLDRLIAAGLATRQSNPDNRRETMLRLTPEGRGLVEEVTAARHREISAIVERLTPGQRTALVGALTAFTEAGGEPTVPGDDSEPYPLGWSDTHARTRPPETGVRHPETHTRPPGARPAHR
ncbi:MarR family winged helix-turn-helix transcriptional regulator [Streptomyces sp. NPDC002018]|uniref:MarR family winged helix-turn-helix transcriptional regulator n=1 Tax=Streptomyces sp. NPDC002018 TaxID=3364629 RepID=UPI003694F333